MLPINTFFLGLSLLYFFIRYTIFDVKNNLSGIISGITLDENIYPETLQ
jgi:hypothetical protein